LPLSRVLIYILNKKIKRMQKSLLSVVLLTLITCVVFGQTNPAITSWLQNTTKTGTYYVSGNSTAQSNGILVNCQKVEYSATSVYVSTRGIPSYPVGPYLDRNPNQAGDQNAIFKLPLIPVVNTGTKTPTTGGNIGVFINGVALFDYRDGVNWSNALNTIQGGPGGGMGDGVWNRDAIIAERAGFDCAKGHPAGTNYHHHQNPSAFNLDLTVLSTVCNLYASDGLYKIDSTKHSPLLGFAYDGFPIYGAYAYKNADATGGIVRMKSSYQLRNITTRTVWADGTDVLDGPPVNTTYPLGYFREDYEYITRAGQADYLDIHNGRFCKTPEYPNGIYCYFATVDAKHNSTYPYVVGPTFYGVRANAKVANITETVTTFTKTTPTKETNLDNLSINIFPNPSADLIVLQMADLVKEDYTVELLDITGRLVQKTQINKGSTIAYFDTQSLYAGTYLVKISNGQAQTTHKVVVQK
jgi:YHYH protein/Secretion system C-terminal sorting domain